jgi:hypothetical protein
MTLQHEWPHDPANWHERRDGTDVLLSIWSLALLIDPFLQEGALLPCVGCDVCQLGSA